MDLTGTVAVITGGGTGIGRATASALDKAGAAGIVVTYSKSASDAEDTVSSLDCRAVAVRSDVASGEAVLALRDHVLEEFGRVDVVVNNAATTCRVPHSDLDGLTDEAFGFVLDVNVIGPYRMARAFAPALREAKGAMVNIASIAGYRAGGSSIAYGVSKAALLQLTRNLAVALAPDVRVNAVAPGTVTTRWQTDVEGFEQRAAAERSQVPLRQTAGPEHVAQAVLGLLAMDMVTGEAVILDGGKHVIY